MPTSPTRPRLVNGSCQLYAALTRAYSPPFRAVYGDEMVRVFGDCCLAAYRDAGTGGLAGVWCRALVDLLRNAPADRVQDFLHDPAARRLLYSVGPVALLLGGVVCWADVNSDEIDVSVLLLLLFAAMLGFAQPRLAFLWALLIGAGVPAIHAVARLRGWQLPYPTNASTPLFALLALLPALGGACAGAWGRRLLVHVRANLRQPALVGVVSVLMVASIYQGTRVFDRKPESPVVRLPHDPWQTLVRDVDQTISIFRRGNVYSDESCRGGVKLVSRASSLNRPVRLALGPRIGPGFPLGH